MTTYPTAFADRFLRLSTVDTIAGVLGATVWSSSSAGSGPQVRQLRGPSDPAPRREQPILGWLYNFLPVYVLSSVGRGRTTAAILLAIKPLAPKLSIAGSLLSILLFVSTISFLFTPLG